MNKNVPGIAVRYARIHRYGRNKLNWGNDRGPTNKLKTALMISVFITLVSVAVLLLVGYLLSYMRAS
jgi:hypothetical protein